MKELPELIARAAKVAGNEKKLADLIGTHQQTITNWKSGRSCPPADVALMAEVAGLDGSEWALRAIYAKYEGTPKGEKLLKAVGKVLLATGAGIAGSGVHAGELAIWAKPVVGAVRVLLDTIYLM